MTSFSPTEHASPSTSSHKAFSSVFLHGSYPRSSTKRRMYSSRCRRSPNRLDKQTTVPPMEEHRRRSERRHAPSRFQRLSLQYEKRATPAASLGRQSYISRLLDEYMLLPSPARDSGVGRGSGDRSETSRPAKAQPRARNKTRRRKHVSDSQISICNHRPKRFLWIPFNI